MAMRKLMTAMIVGFSLQFLTAQVWANQRIALVIGNAAYQHGSGLANPLNDANDIGAALGRLGFKVTKLENADYDGMRRGLKAFTRAAATSEIALVFYAGHGIEVDKRNFLIPVDARLLSDREVEFETVSLDLVSRAVEGAAGLGLVILDACRDNPFAAAMKRSGAKRSIGRGLARVEPSGETLVAYAAKGGSVAEDGKGRNSPYSTALLAHVEEPGLEVGLMFRKVRDAVLKATGGLQEPFVYGSLSSKGAYLKALPRPPTPVVKSVPKDTRREPIAPGGDKRLTAEQLAAERVFWESVKDSKNATEIGTYLNQYPKGTYAALARTRLKGLTDTTQEVIPGTKVLPEPQTAPEPRVSPEAAETSIGLKARERRMIQSALASLGFNAGSSDGIFGPRTRAAIGKWQASRGKSPTGFLDAEEAKELFEKGQMVSGYGKQAARATLAKALGVAARIQEQHVRSHWLASIGEVQAKAGDVVGAKRTIADALAVAERIPKHDPQAMPPKLPHREMALLDVAEAQANIGDFRRARMTAPTDQYRAIVLSTIAKAQAKAGDIRAAEESTSAALALWERVDPEQHTTGVREVASGQARAGNVPGAFAVLKRVKGRRGRVLVLFDIAAAQAEAGDFKGAAQVMSEAIEMANRTDDLGFQVKALCLRAQVQVKFGDTQAVASSISAAMRTAQHIGDKMDHDWALRDIAEAQAKAGDGAGAISTTQRIGDKFYRDWALSDIAEAQAKAGDIASALETKRRVDVGNVLPGVIGEIAAAQAKAGDIGEAMRTARGAVETHTQVWALVRIAEVQVEAATK